MPRVRTRLIGRSLVGGAAAFAKAVVAARARCGMFAAHLFQAPQAPHHRATRAGLHIFAHIPAHVARDAAATWIHQARQSNTTRTTTSAAANGLTTAATARRSRTMDRQNNIHLQLITGSIVDRRTLSRPRWQLPRWKTAGHERFRTITVCPLRAWAHKRTCCALPALPGPDVTTVTRTRGLCSRRTVLRSDQSFQVSSLDCPGSISTLSSQPREPEARGGGLS